MVMKETIRLFFNTYGADGDNDDFKELLEYAHNIKSKRLERQQKHDLLQQEYEQALGIFEPETAAQEKAAPGLEVIDDADDDGDFAKYQKIFEDLKKEYNVDSYEFDTEQGKVAIVSNLKEALKEHLDFNTRMMPKAFAAHFISFVMNNPEISDSYILTTLLAEKVLNFRQMTGLWILRMLMTLLFHCIRNIVTNTQSQTGLQNRLLLMLSLQ